jgi:hypothetical protein
MRALGLILLQLVMSLIVTASVMAAAIVAVPPLRDRPALGAGLDGRGVCDSVRVPGPLVAKSARIEGSGRFACLARGPAVQPGRGSQRSNPAARARGQTLTRREGDSNLYGICRSAQRPTSRKRP